MWFAAAKPPYGTLDAAEWAPSTASKADICAATSHVRFTPNSDRESEFPQRAMSALPPKADMCGATRNVRFGPNSGHSRRGSFQPGLAHALDKLGHCAAGVGDIPLNPRNRDHRL